MSAGKSFTVFRGKGGKLVKDTATLPELTADRVAIEIKACGLCFSDIHYLDSGYVLGHEAVGVVVALGPEVRHQIKVGDKVGWSYNHGACLRCEQCLAGNDIHCPEKQFYARADKDQGGFGEYFVIREDFCFKIPDDMSFETAAPLMCAGATVFSPFFNLGIKATDRVGIIGIGGLGHLALQVANKWGCHVAAFSSTEKKRDEALSFGAREYIVTNVPEGETFAPKRVEDKFDWLLCTVSRQVPWEKYFACLKPRGKMVPLGLDVGMMSVPYLPIIEDELAIQGSVVANRLALLKMLEFFDRHKIRPLVETLPMDEEHLNVAVERLQKGDIRYRFVLKRSD